MSNGKEISVGNAFLRIVSTREEFQVHVYISGRKAKALTYYTDDREDAEQTMITMANDLLIKGYKGFNPRGML